MRTDQLISTAYDFHKFLRNDRFDCTLKDYRLEGPFMNLDKPEVLNAELAQKSGVYLFSSRDHEVWYIGKAAANNFASEIWGKFSTRRPPFNHQWKSDNNLPTVIKEKLAEGLFFLTMLHIEPSYLSSAFEVFLQVKAQQIDTRLPLLNKRIG